MPNLLVIAHAPLASALRQVAEHTFPDCAPTLTVLDVHPGMCADDVETAARTLMAAAGQPEWLVLTDVFGATPCNVAQKVVDGHQSKLVVGVNLPMLLRTVNYRHEPLDVLVTRALAGGTQSIMQVAVTAPQNQHRKTHDQHQHDHSQ